MLLATRKGLDSDADLLSPQQRVQVEQAVQSLARAIAWSDLPRKQSSRGWPSSAPRPIPTRLRGDASCAACIRSWQ